MPDSQREWLDGLRERGRRAQLRLSTVSTKQFAAEKRILATGLLAWLNTDLGPLLQQNAESSAEQTVPGIVITTSPSGLEAAREILAQKDSFIDSLRDRLICVREADYRLWLRRNPDPHYRWHINHWTWIKTTVPTKRWSEYTQFPLGPDECYWLHRTGTSGAGSINRRFCHLWKCDGEVAVLLKAFVSETGVNELGATD